MPLDFLFEQNLSGAFRGDFARGRLPALDDRQAGGAVFFQRGVDPSGLVRIRRSEAAAQQLSDGILQFLVFVQGAKFHFLDQIIGQIQGGFHKSSLLVSQLYVNLDASVDLQEVVLKGLHSYGGFRSLASRWDKEARREPRATWQIRKLGGTFELRSDLTASSSASRYLGMVYLTTLIVNRARWLDAGLTVAGGWKIRGPV